MTKKSILQIYLFHKYQCIIVAFICTALFPNSFKIPISYKMKRIKVINHIPLIKTSQRDYIQQIGNATLVKSEFQNYYPIQKSFEKNVKSREIAIKCDHFSLYFKKLYLSVVHHSHRHKKKTLVKHTETRSVHLTRNMQQ